MSQSDYDILEKLKMHWEELSNNECSLTENGKKSLLTFLNYLDPDEIKDNMEIATNRIPQNERIEDRFKYFCGICWCEIKEAPFSTKKKEDV